MNYEQDREIVRAVLRASGHAELVAALEAARPIIYAETKVKALYGKIYGDANEALALIDAALAAVHTQKETFHHRV
jgi:hypothetical protein